MDEIEQDSKASSSLFGRYRSPTFKQQEVKALLHLIEKHKKVVLNKSNNASANYAKDKVWETIAKEINKLNVGPDRAPEVWKTKWENLKRSARKLSKDVMDEDCEFNRDEINKTLRLICDESQSNENDGQQISLQSLIGCEDDGAEFKLWASDLEQDASSFNLDDDHNEIQKEKYEKFEASPRFSSQECQILLQCVRQEKNVLFSKTSLFKRHQAWKRIAQSYNNQSPRKRTSKELSSKFNTLKTMAKRVNMKALFKEKKRKKYEQLYEEMKPDVEKIKSELTGDYEMDSDDQVLNNLVNRSSSDHLLFNQDPLNAHGSNSDSGLGSCPDTKDETRLKIELLNYKMETARLERKRVEEAMRHEQKEREMRELEQSLRLRTARLELAAAEAKLPPHHPALKYSLDEKVLY